MARGVIYLAAATYREHQGRELVLQIVAALQAENRDLRFEARAHLLTLAPGEALILTEIMRCRGWTSRALLPGLFSALFIQALPLRHTLCVINCE